MSRCDHNPIEALSFPCEAGLPSRLPIHIRAADDEALVSWLWRLASGMGISMRTLSHLLIGAPVVGEALAWCRPDPSALRQMAARAGTRIEGLRSMTFHALCPSVRDDEVNDRFCSRRFLRANRQWPLRCRISVCPACLRDAPYLRSCWMLGWISVCPQHRIVLLNHCPHCAQRLRMPGSQKHTPGAIDRCGHCRGELGAAPENRAHVEVVKLEEALLLGKRHGHVELANCGSIDWRTAIAMIDVLLSLVRVGTTPAHRERFCARIVRDFQLPYGNAWRWPDRYGSSLTVTWLLQDWPRNLKLSRSLLRSPPLNRVIARSTQLDAPLRSSLCELFSARAKPETERFKARRWIAQLPQSAHELRVQAMGDRFRHRRLRLLAMAELRDGRSVRDTAAAVGVTMTTLYQWLSSGARGGLEAALARKRAVGRRGAEDARGKILDVSTGN